MRSWLICDANDAAGLADARNGAADVLVLDLTAAGPADKPAARAAACAVLAQTMAKAAGACRRYVMIHPLSPWAQADLEAVMPAAPDGILLPGATSGADVQQLDVMLSVAEALAGLAAGRTRIVAMCGDTAAGALAAASFSGKSQRLQALAWSGTALSGHLGAALPAQAGVPFADSVRLARALTLLGATAAGVGCLDCWPQDAGDLPDDAGHRARAEGFSGMLVRRAADLPALHAAWRDPPPAATARPGRPDT